MQKPNRTYRSYEPLEIAVILYLNSKKLSDKEVSLYADRTKEAIGQLLSKYRAWKAGRGEQISVSVPLAKAFKKAMNVNANDILAYVEAREKGFERNNVSVIETVEVTKPAEASTDVYADLEKADRNFRQAIASFVEAEVERRTQEAIKTKENEIIQLKTSYEQELQRLQAVLVEAKNSSIVGMIKNKWQTR